jgi:hypothetical protein
MSDTHPATTPAITPALMAHTQLPVKNSTRNPVATAATKKNTRYLNELMGVLLAMPLLDVFATKENMTAGWHLAQSDRNPVRAYMNQRYGYRTLRAWLSHALGGYTVPLDPGEDSSKGRSGVSSYSRLSEKVGCVHVSRGPSRSLLFLH